MSHIVSIKTQTRDPAAISAACRRLGLAEPAQGTVKLYSAAATGLLVKLPGWQFPVVIDTATGGIQFDNYGGKWGEQKELDKLLQAYAVEKSLIEARRNGRTVTEQPLADGFIKVVIAVGTGGAAL